MALIVVLTFLFAGWMFWGWMVSEHRNIAWMKKWCSILFILTALVISFGTGAGMTLVLLKGRQREQVRQFAVAIETKLQNGQTQNALSELQKVIESPDEWSNDSTDLLKRMVASTERLQEHEEQPEELREDLPQTAERSERTQTQ